MTLAIFYIDNLKCFSQLCWHVLEVSTVELIRSFESINTAAHMTCIIAHTQLLFGRRNGGGFVLWDTRASHANIERGRTKQSHKYTVFWHDYQFVLKYTKQCIGHNVYIHINHTRIRYHSKINGSFSVICNEVVVVKSIPDPHTNHKSCQVSGDGSK